MGCSRIVSCYLLQKSSQLYASYSLILIEKFKYFEISDLLLTLIYKHGSSDTSYRMSDVKTSVGRNRWSETAKLRFQSRHSFSLFLLLNNLKYWRNLEIFAISVDFIFFSPSSLWKLKAICVLCLLEWFYAKCILP